MEVERNINNAVEKQMKENRSINIGEDNLGIANTGNDNEFIIYINSRKPQTLQQAIAEWQSQTKIPLNPKLVLQSRDKEIEELVSLLIQTPSKIIVVSLQSKEDSYAFILNAFNIKEEYADRVKIISRQESWDSTVNTQDSLILVYKGFTPTNIGLAIAKGHFVIEAEESVTMKDETHNVITLPKIKKSVQASTLEEMGFDYKNAWKIIEDTKGFFHAIVQHPLLQPYERINPEWVEKYSLDILITILFLNSWNKTNEADIEIINKLSGMKYEDLEKELHLLAKKTNTPIRLVGNVWQVISKINLWDLIVNKISDTHLNKFKSIAIEVFTEIDPAYELAPEERSYAHIYKKVMKHSVLLCDSIADTLVMLSVFGNTIDNIQQIIDTWLKEIFESNLKVEAWYSYHQNLPLLAEASPESFLSALKKSLDVIGETKIDELFVDNDDLMMGECSYCHLLWALETVSWNKDYLVRVVLILARLSDLDITYGRVNQPFNSLKDIFTGRVRYSSATHDERIGIIKNILLKKYPEITWKLLLELLPSNHSMSTGISKPKYHTWADIDDTVLQKDYVKYCNDIDRLLYGILDEDSQKWHDVFDNIDKFYEEYFFKIVDKFITLDKEIFDNDMALLIANTLRSKIHNHRSHPDTHWALPKKFVDKLEEVFHFIEPDDLIGKYQYLFGMGSVDILEPIPYNPDTFSEDHKKEDNIVEILRQEAIEKILTDGTLSDLEVLIKQSSYAWDTGRIIFTLYSEKYQETMLGWVEGEDRLLAQCAKSYLQQLTRKSFDESILEGLSDIQKSEIILALPFGAKAFEVLKRQNTNVQKLYWENLSWYYVLEGEDVEYFNWVVEQFYTHGVSHKSIEIMSHMFCLAKKEHDAIEIDTEQLFKILYEMDPNNTKLNFHSTSEVIKYLQKSNLKEEDKRFLEWKYLMMNNFKPVYWERLIINDATAFAELVSWVYKPEAERDEDKTLTQEQIMNRAKNAKELLERMRLFRNYDDIEPMDSDQLKSWVQIAREQFKNLDRTKIGDRQIGMLLAKSSGEEEGIFPNKIVCEVIEELGTDSLEDSFVHEVLYPNGSRFTTRGADEGGNQEHALADKYQDYAKSMQLIYPRTSKILQKISDSYRYDAKREDMENEL